MDVSKVGTSQNTTNQVSNQAKEAVKAANIAAAAKTDRVEISSRNPANKKELMATYSDLRTQMPQMRNQAILNSAAGGAATLNFKAPQVITNNNAPAPTAAAAPQAPAAANPNNWNVAVNAGNVNVTVENGKAAATPQTADNTNPANPLSEIGVG